MILTITITITIIITLGIIYANFKIWSGVIESKDSILVIMTLSITFISIIFIALGATHYVYRYNEHVASQITPTINEVDVEVTHKEFKPAVIMPVPAGKIIVPITIKPKYIVKISSGNLDETIDDEKLFNQLDVGDKFKMEHIIYIKEDGSIIRQGLSFVGLGLDEQ